MIGELWTLFCGDFGGKRVSLTHTGDIDSSAIENLWIIGATKDKNMMDFVLNTYIH